MTEPLSLPKAKAREILDRLGIESPAVLRSLKEICVERGAFVRERRLEGAEARLVVSGNRGIITVNPDDSHVGRARFSIAHELGHFELHRSRESAWACGSSESGIDPTGHGIDPRDGIEAEANEFAAELLMPERFIKPELAVARPGLALLKDLASRYQTSLSAIAHRFAELE